MARAIRRASDGIPGGHGDATAKGRRVNFDDPAWLDTLAFAGASTEEVRRVALAGREGLAWYEDPLCYVRTRAVRGAGERPTLVFLPDAPATIESYDSVVARAGAAGWNCGIVEIPGFGYSWPVAPEALEFETTARLTADAIASLDFGPVVLVGPCVQGLVALAIARARPDLVRACLVLQTGDWAAQAAWGGRALDPKGAMQRPYAAQVRFRLQRERVAIDWWARFAAGPDFDVADLQAGARAVVRNHGAYALASLAQKWFARENEPELASEVPATVLWGLADASHATTDRASIRRYVPHARFVELPKAGHFTDLEAIGNLLDAAEPYR